MRALPDHYATLGLPSSASAREIRAARRKLLRRHHPDVAPEGREDAEARTKEILVASEVLLDSHARAAYDAAWRLRHGARPRAADTETEREDEAPRPDLTCEACGRVNISARWNACIFCGAGIGPTPQPVDRNAWRSVDIVAPPSPFTILFQGCAAGVAVLVLSSVTFLLPGSTRVVAWWFGLALVAVGGTVAAMRRAKRG